MKKILNSVKTFLDNTSKTAKLSKEIREGLANQSSLINRKLTELIEVTKGMHGTPNNIRQINEIDNGYQGPPKTQTSSGDALKASNEALKSHPLMFANKTYNTSHPDYDATLARNFPGKIFNIDKNLGNPLYTELRALIQDEEIPEARWSNILKETLTEAITVPHANQVFERKEFVEKYLKELENKYQAFYNPGWVNLDDALFLYWVVRRLKPKTIVQTGVCNGLSSAFMMLALAKNGPDGTLHVVDMPPVFNSNDDVWKVKGKVYGVVIPEGKTSGWLVPDAYRDRFEVLNGDAKDLLPGLLQKVGNIDMFYHDSDHTYDHMMFEFMEAKKYLNKNGVMVSDDISWNASLWDFADGYAAPAYNYRGSMGIACF